MGPHVRRTAGAFSPTNGSENLEMPQICKENAISLSAFLLTINQYLSLTDTHTDRPGEALTAESFSVTELYL